MTYKINADRTAAVTNDVKWKRIDEHTPRGVKLQLIAKPYGVAQYGIHTPNKFFTHWAPAPTFDKDET